MLVPKCSSISLKTNSLIIIKDKMQFKFINRWPRTHKRNIEIAIKVAEGNSCRKVGKLFGVCGNRANQIYRILRAHLYSQMCDVPYRHAIEIKDLCTREDALKMLTLYRNTFYIDLPA